MGTVTGGNQPVTITGDVVVAEPVTVDGTVTATPTGTQAVSAVSLPLPADAATQTTLAALLTDSQAKADLAETQPVSAASLPLPSGAATAALQLPDSHNVTVDNAAGAAAVHVQDGGNSLTVDGTVTANPATYFGKTITYVSVNQTIAGTTELVAASGGNKHKLLGAALVMSLVGTLKFTSTGDLTGPMDIATNGGFVLPTSVLPYLESNVGVALNLVTTLGAARGFVVVLTEA